MESFPIGHKHFILLLLEETVPGTRPNLRLNIAADCVYQVKTQLRISRFLPTLLMPPCKGYRQHMEAAAPITASRSRSGREKHARALTDSNESTQTGVLATNVPRRCQPTVAGLKGPITWAQKREPCCVRKNKSRDIRCNNGG